MFKLKRVFGNNETIPDGKSTDPHDANGRENPPPRRKRKAPPSTVKSLPLASTGAVGLDEIEKSFGKSSKRNSQKRQSQMVAQESAPLKGFFLSSSVGCFLLFSSV